MVIRSNPPSGLKRRGDAAAGEGVNAAIIKAGERGISKVICCRSLLVHLLSWLLKFCWRSFSFFTPRQWALRHDPWTQDSEKGVLVATSVVITIRRSICKNKSSITWEQKTHTHRVIQIRVLKSTTVPRWTNSDTQEQIMQIQSRTAKWYHPPAHSAWYVWNEWSGLGKNRINTQYMMRRMMRHAEGARGWARQPHLEEHAATEGTLLQEQRSNIPSERIPEERKLIWKIIYSQSFWSTNHNKLLWTSTVMFFNCCNAQDALPTVVTLQNIKKKL